MTKESRVTSRGDRDRSWESLMGVRGLGGSWLAMFEAAVGLVPGEDCGPRGVYAGQQALMAARTQQSGVLMRTPYRTYVGAGRAGVELGSESGIHLAKRRACRLLQCGGAAAGRARANMGSSTAAVAQRVMSGYRGK